MWTGVTSQLICLVSMNCSLGIFRSVYVTIGQEIINGDNICQWVPLRVYS